MARTTQQRGQVNVKSGTFKGSTILKAAAGARNTRQSSLGVATIAGTEIAAGIAKAAKTPLGVAAGGGAAVGGAVMTYMPGPLWIPRALIGAPSSLAGSLKALTSILGGLRD